MRNFEYSAGIINKMIEEATKLMNDAVSYENWMRAADLKSYIDGMKMALVVFEINNKES